MTPDRAIQPASSFEALGKQAEDLVITQTLDLQFAIVNSVKESSSKERLNKTQQFMTSTVESAMFDTTEAKSESFAQFIKQSDFYGKFATSAVEALQEIDLILGKQRVQDLDIDVSIIANDRFEFDNTDIIRKTKVLQDSKEWLSHDFFESSKIARQTVAEAIKNIDFGTQESSVTSEQQASKLIGSIAASTFHKPEGLSVKSSLSAVDRASTLIVTQCDRVKSAFSVYNTALLLYEDTSASVELITEAVALQESHIAAKTTQTAQLDAGQQLQAPHYLNARYLIDRSDEVWSSWDTLNKQYGGLF